MSNRYWRSLEASVCFDMLIGATGGHMSLLPQLREMTPFFVARKQFLKFPRNAGFYLTIRNPPIVQIVLMGLPFGIWGIRVSFGPNRS